MSQYYRNMDLLSDPTLGDSYVIDYAKALGKTPKPKSQYQTRTDFGKDYDGFLTDTAQVLGITAASAVTSLYNGVTGLANIATHAVTGENVFDKMHTTSLITDSWVDDYRRSQVGYDIAGEVVSSILPGLGAVKLARAASKGARGLGRFFDDTYYMRKQSEAYRKVVRSVKATDSWDKASYINNTLAIGAGRAAVEGAIFELGAYTATQAASDITNKDLSGLDVVSRLGMSVVYGVGFGAALGGLGGYVANVANVGKRLSKKYSSGIEVETLSRAAPLGSQVSKFRSNIEEVSGKLDQGGILDDHMSTQSAGIDNAISDMLVGGTDNPMFTPLSIYAKEAPQDHVDSLFVGTQRFLGMGATDEVAVTRVPGFIQSHLKTYADGADRPLIALKKQYEIDPTVLPGDVREWIRSADISDYTPSIMYVNLKDGSRALTLENPSMADYGIAKIRTNGSSSDAYIRLHNGKDVRFGDSLEGDRILAKARYLDGDGYYPNKRLDLDRNLAMYEAMYFAKSADTPTRNAQEALFPRGINSIEELRDELVASKYSRYRELLEKGDGFDKVEQKLGVTDEVSLLDENPADWLNLDKLVTEPQWVRMRVAPESFSLDAQKSILWDRRAYSQLMDNAKQTHYEITGIPAERMPKLEDGVLQAASTAGATLLRSAPSTGEYLGTEHALNSIGTVLHNITQDGHKVIRQEGMDAMYAGMKADREGVQHFVHAMTWMEGQSVGTYLQQIEGKTYIALDETAQVMQASGRIPEGAILGEDFIEVVNDNASRWFVAWHNANRPLARNKFKAMSAEGKHPTFDPEALYIPPQDIKFGAFVYQTDGLAGNSRVGMIRAQSSKELKDKILRVKKLQPNMTIRTINGVEDFYKVTGTLDVSRKFSLELDKSGFSKKGVATNITPDLNPQNLVDRLDRHLLSTIAKNNRTATRLFYSREVSVLEDLHARQIGTAKSGSREVVDRYELRNTPASKALKTMLDIAPDTGLAMLDQANKSVEKHISLWYNRAKQFLMDKSGKHSREILGDNPEKSLANLEKLFEDINGVSFKTAKDVLIDSRPDVNKQQLQKFLGEVNGYAASLMLRSDGLDGLVNNMSAVILGSPEFKAILKRLNERQKEDLMKYVTLDSGNANTLEYSGINSVLSGMKLMTNRVELDAFRERWKEWKVWESQDELHDQISHVIDDTFANGLQNMPAATTKIRTLWKGVKKAAFFTSDKLNDHAQMQVLHFIDNIGNIAGLTDAEKIVLATNAKSRILGATIPSQKPTLFHGAIGTPLGLYQNYNLNVLNSMLRYAGEKGQATRFAILQGGIFGMQGLPGFSQLNTAVHDIYGKEDGADLKSIIDDTTGTRAMKWLLYGAGSNVLDSALYTRGDLNPRNRFILPSKLDEIPAVNFLNGIKNIAVDTVMDVNNGASITTSLADNLAHSHINRPLTGIIEGIRGYSTTGHGKLAQRNEDANRYTADASFWKSNVARIMGARPLDEAIVRERVYRLSTYQRTAQNHITELGSAVDKELLATKGKLEQETVDRFLLRFIASGRQPQDFEHWFKIKVKRFNQDAIDRLERTIKKSQYYQPYKQYFVDEGYEG